MTRRPPSLGVGIAACAIGATLAVVAALSLRSELAARQRNRASYLDAHQTAFEAAADANEAVFDEVEAYLDRDLRRADQLLATINAEHRSLKHVELPRAPGFEDESAHVAAFVEADHRFLQAISRLVRRDPMNTPSEAAETAEERWDETRELAADSSEDVGIASPPLDDQTRLVDRLARRVTERGQERRDLRDEVATREADLVPRRAALQRYAQAMLALLQRHRALQDELDAYDYSGQQVRSTTDQDAYESTMSSHSSERHEIAGAMWALTPPASLRAINDRLADDVSELGDLVDGAYYAASEVNCYADEVIDPFSDPFSDPFYEPEPIVCLTLGESDTYRQYLTGQEPVQRDYERLRLEWLALYEQEFRSLYDAG